MIKVKRVYRKGDVDTPEKINLLWINLKQDIGIEQQGDLRVEIQRHLFSDDVTVVFSVFGRYSG